MDVYFQNPENTVTYNPVREFYLNSIILEVLVEMGSLQNQEGLIWSHSILRQNVMQNFTYINVIFQVNV